MIFWILVCAAVITFVAVYWYNATDWDDKHRYWLEGIGWGAFWGATGFGVGVGLLSLITMPMAIWTPIPTGEQRSDLSALDTGESVEGEFHQGFFVGYGYVQGTRVIEYMTQEEDGAYRLLRVNADDARVYQGADEPYMVERQCEYRNDLIVPWGFECDSEYDFHVPEGSVLTDQYIVEN